MKETLSSVKSLLILLTLRSVHLFCCVLWTSLCLQAYRSDPALCAPWASEPCDGITMYNSAGPVAQVSLLMLCSVCPYMPTHDLTACMQVYEGEEVITSVESLQGEKPATPIWLFSCFKFN